MTEEKITLCKLSEFAASSGLFDGMKPPCYRTLLNWKKRKILATDPLTNLIDVEESKRRFLFRRHNRTTVPNRHRK